MPAGPNPRDMIIVQTMVNVIHQANIAAKISDDDSVPPKIDDHARKAYEVGTASPRTWPTGH